MNIKISKQNIEKLKLFDSPTISNAIENFKVRDETDGYASNKLKCLIKYEKPMVGFAVTAKIDTVTPGPIKGRNNKFAELFDLLNKSPKPAVVVIQYLSPDRFRCCVVGDMLSTAFQRIGAVGIITDGGVRDLTGICKRAPGFYIFIGNGSFPWIP